jgi:HSP20 family protein
MNVTHPNYGQSYRLTRAALRLGTFTISELEDLTGAPKNTVYSFVSKLQQVGEGMLKFADLKSLRGRPQKRYSLTESGTKYLADLSFEMASRFGDESETSYGEHKLGQALLPPSDIYEQDEELFFQVEVPGMSEEDVDVRIEENDLVVSGERPAALTRRGARAFMVERQHGRFVRTYTLPKTGNAKIRHVAVRNGLLEVTLEKTASAASEESDSDSRVRAKTSGFHQLEETAGS